MGDPESIWRIKNDHPRFRGMPDSEIEALRSR